MIGSLMCSTKCEARENKLVVLQQRTNAPNVKFLKSTMALIFIYNLHSVSLACNISQQFLLKLKKFCSREKKQYLPLYHYIALVVPVFIQVYQCCYPLNFFLNHMVLI